MIEHATNIAESVNIYNVSTSSTAFFVFYRLPKCCLNESAMPQMDFATLVVYMYVYCEKCDACIVLLNIIHGV